MDLITNAADLAPVIEAFRGVTDRLNDDHATRPYASERPIVRETNRDAR